MNLLLFFIILNIINVILQTMKSLLTHKGDKWSAAIANAVTYGVYTILLIYMTCELSLVTKVFVVGGCNLIGVFIVKLIEEKLKKERLWKIEVTMPTKYTMIIDTMLKDIPHSYITISPKHTLFNFYCDTQDQSREVKNIVQQYGAKHFVSESQIL